MDFSGAQRIKVKNAVSVHLQRALKDPSRGIKIISGEMIGYFPPKKLPFIYVFTSSCLALRCACVLCALRFETV